MYESISEIGDILQNRIQQARNRHTNALDNQKQAELATKQAADYLTQVTADFIDYETYKLWREQQ